MGSKNNDILHLALDINVSKHWELHESEPSLYDVFELRRKEGGAYLMPAKHVYNSADGLVLKSLRGVVALNPALRLHIASKSVYTSDESHDLPSAQRPPRPSVAVISGGGAGHEPAHAGYTGRGMLTASVSGDIFASPSAKQILQTIYLASSSGVVASEADKASAGPIGWKDVLVVINNYTGDRLNFGLAIEKALASSHMNVESVVVADDVSLLRPVSASESVSVIRRRLVGARGLAGNILVCKMLGAFAQRGADLGQLKILGDAVVHNLASVGVGLGHCHVPGRELSSSNDIAIAEDEYEIGLGLHNEPGVVRKKMQGPEKLVEEMLGLLSKDGSGFEFLHVASHERPLDTIDDMVLFVNNLGGMSQLELGAIMDEVLGQLASIGVRPVRMYSSSYMTSLNAPGFSISILNLSNIIRSLEASPSWNASANVLDLLDDPTDAVAWVGVHSWPVQRRALPEIISPLPLKTTRDALRSKGVPNRVERGIRAACESVLLQQEALTQFDTVLGDGDCGDTFGAGARAVLAVLDEGKIDVADMAPHKLVGIISDVLEDRMGGIIGALFAIFLTALSVALKESGNLSTLQDWRVALNVALNALGKYTPAQIGDRTLIDALAPFCEAFSINDTTLEQAVDAARRGAESTSGMQAILGRAAYVTLPADIEKIPPDPGAWGVLAILEGFCKAWMDDV